MTRNKKIFYASTLCAILLAFIALPLTVMASSSIIGNLTNVANAAGLQKVNDLKVLIGTIIKVILGFLGLIFTILILLGGYEWMMAQGDPGKVNKAKDLIKNAIIGVIIVILAYSITYYVVTNIQGAVSGTAGGTSGGVVAPAP